MTPETPTQGWFWRWWRELSPPALLVLSFGVLVVLATLGLYLLPGLVTGEPLRFIDALFTATSAVCVTGLVVVDTATAFTRAGQAWILLFIQLGGIGLIALTTLIIGALGRQLSLRSEMITLPPVELTRFPTVVGLVVSTARFMLVLEILGALVLWALWTPTFGLSEAAWHGLFHAVSAFCNAGFSTLEDSLVRFSASRLTLAVIGLLVVVGGFGFLSSAELVRWWRAGGRRGPRRLSTHTWAALVSTVALLVLGALLYALFEWDGVLGALPLGDRLANAGFMSVTPRTAGFHTVPYAQVGNETAFLTLLLMVIGGSPGSTAGGIKTTAFAVLAGLALSRMRGYRHVRLHDRSIPDGTIQRTVSLVLLAFAVTTTALFILAVTESRGLDVQEARQAFLPVLFEAVSAFNTVGLSMDVTPGLSPAGKLVVIVLMFVGRVGPLAFFAALSLRARALPAQARPAREDLIVG